MHVRGMHCKTGFGLLTHAKHTNSVTSSKCKAALNGCTYEKPYLNAQFILKMWLFYMQAIIGLNVYLPAITTVSLDLSIIDSAFFFCLKKYIKRFCEQLLLTCQE